MMCRQNILNKGFAGRIFILLGVRVGVCPDFFFIPDLIVVMCGSWYATGILFSLLMLRGGVGSQRICGFFGRVGVNLFRGVVPEWELGVGGPGDGP
jgi:hypothetical protein